jgi:hypothetical protein
MDELVAIGPTASPVDAIENPDRIATMRRGRTLSFRQDNTSAAASPGTNTGGATLDYAHQHHPWTGSRRFRLTCPCENRDDQNHDPGGRAMVLATRRHLRAHPDVLDVFRFH